MLNLIFGAKPSKFYKILSSVYRELWNKLSLGCGKHFFTINELYKKIIRLILCYCECSCFYFIRVKDINVSLYIKGKNNQINNKTMFIKLTTVDSLSLSFSSSWMNFNLNHFKASYITSLNYNQNIYNIFSKWVF